ncbi:electron transfer flavoprotein subunit alpha/FixB family protein [Kineosporia sp. R_H_3]|uniref:electron transfer flavoprotein subunit alpha/FixB family protein n=1 Tax=Kineosporia sp. R_H_3 TaxID=1961848 RepID=UPI000B4B3A27|nr:electron transfer flavoprotein subunit alpha/FixB family protein [Kineosporia sp. R_H_3]
MSDPAPQVLVLVETVPADPATGRSGTVRRPSLEQLTVARRLGTPAALVCGPADDDVVAVLGQHGAATVYVVDAPEVGGYLVGPKVDAVAAVVDRGDVGCVLVTSNPEGKEVGGRVAVRLGSGIVTDAVDVQAGDGGPVATQAVVAGQWLATSQVVRGVPVIAVRPNAAPVEPAPVQAVVEKVDVTFAPSSLGARVVSRTPRATTGRPELTAAPVVVAGGRGVGSAAGFAVVEALADALGGAVGASRAATDESWYGHQFQIGQTGKTVAPALYVAAGISGAIQHRAGMQSARTVVAVNKDAKAPIFALADLGVVGDLHTVLPQVVAEIARRRA